MRTIRLLLAALAIAPLLPSPALGAPAPGTVTGRVLDPRGAPVARFTVNGVPFGGAHGTFELPLPMGDSRLVFRAPGFAPVVVGVHATDRGTSGRRFTLPDLVVGAGASLIGEVVDAESGAPVAAARAALAGPPDFPVRDGARPERLSDVAATGKGGAYLIRRAARGRALLVVSHPDYLPEVVPVRTAVPLPTIRLQRGGVIEGVARGADGRPLPFARVIAASTGAADAQEVRSDAMGAFRLERLRAGTYTVVARGARAGAATAESVRVRDGEETRILLAANPRRPAVASR